MNQSVENRAASFLGLCRRAGQIVLGQDACTAAARSGKAAIVLMDADASANTLDRMREACSAHHVPLWEMNEIHPGDAIGRPGCKVLAVPPGGMADKLLSLMEGK